MRNFVTNIKETIKKKIPEIAIDTAIEKGVEGVTNVAHGFVTTVLLKIAIMLVAVGLALYGIIAGISMIANGG